MHKTCKAENPNMICKAENLWADIHKIYKEQKSVNLDTNKKWKAKKSINRPKMHNKKP